MSEVNNHWSDYDERIEAEESDSDDQSDHVESGDESFDYKKFCRLVSIKDSDNYLAKSLLREQKLIRNEKDNHQQIRHHVWDCRGENFAEEVTWTNDKCCIEVLSGSSTKEDEEKMMKEEEEKIRLEEEEKVTKAKEAEKRKKDLRKEAEEFKVIKEVPKSFSRFRELIYDLNPKISRFPKDFRPFKFSRCKLQSYYEDESLYLKIYIPLVLEDFWKEVTCFHSQCQNTSLSIVSFWKLLESNYSLSNIKCYIHRDKTTESPFLFGQLVKLHFVKNSNEEQSFYYFGIVNSIVVVPFRRDTTEKENDFSPDNDLQNIVIDELEIEMKTLEFNSLTLKSVEVVSKSIQSLLLQAKSVYKIYENKETGTNKFYKQILNPSFDLQNLGFLINMEKRTSIKYSDEQIEAIQKAYQIFFDASKPIIFCIAGQPQIGKTEIIREVIMQLIKFGSEKLKEKILLISSQEIVCRSIIEQLKHYDIQVYHAAPKSSSFSKEEKLKKYAEIIDFDTSNDIQTKESYRQCLDYYQDKIKFEDLSSLAVVSHNNIKNRAKYDFIKNSKVIIGDIKSICNDLLINHSFNQENIKNVIIDDANQLTELEIIQLSCFGVEKMVLAGNPRIAPNMKQVNFEKRPYFDAKNIILDESLSCFHRYAKLNREKFENPDSKTMSLNSMAWLSPDREKRKFDEEKNKRDTRTADNKTNFLSRKNFYPKFNHNQESYNYRGNSRRSSDRNFGYYNHSRGSRLYQGPHQPRDFNRWNESNTQLQQHPGGHWTDQNYVRFEMGSQHPQYNNHPTGRHFYQGENSFIETGNYGHYYNDSNYCHQNEPNQSNMHQSQYPRSFRRF